MVLVGGCFGGARRYHGRTGRLGGGSVKEWEVFPAGTPLRLMVLVGGCCGGVCRYYGRTGRLGEGSGKGVGGFPGRSSDPTNTNLMAGLHLKATSYPVSYGLGGRENVKFFCQNRQATGRPAHGAGQDGRWQSISAKKWD